MASGQVGLLSWTIVEPTPSRSEVKITGEIDLAVAGALASALDESLRLGDLVVLNLRDVSFMDSTGLHLFLDLKRRIEGAGGDLVLTSVSEAVGRLLEVTGTASFFDHTVRVNPAPIRAVAGTSA